MAYIKDSRGVRIKDLTNQRFGRLIALYPTGEVRSGWAVWYCECDCGAHIEATGTSLGRDRLSCGCLHKEVTARINQKRCRKRPYEWLLLSLKTSCRLTGRDINLSYEEFYTFTQVDTCHYCSEPIRWTTPYTYHGSNGAGNYRVNLDRKNNLVGYTQQNCVVCCWICNNSKGDRYSYEEWSAMASALREYRERLAKGATA